MSLFLELSNPGNCHNKNPGLSRFSRPDLQVQTLNLGYGKYSLYELVYEATMARSMIRRATGTLKLYNLYTSVDAFDVTELVRSKPGLASFFIFERSLG